MGNVNPVGIAYDSFLNIDNAKQHHFSSSSLYIEFPEESLSLAVSQWPLSYVLFPQMDTGWSTSSDTIFWCTVDTGIVPPTQKTTSILASSGVSNLSDGYGSRCVVGPRRISTYRRWSSLFWFPPYFSRQGCSRRCIIDACGGLVNRAALRSSKHWPLSWSVGAGGKGGAPQQRGWRYIFLRFSYIYMFGQYVCVCLGWDVGIRCVCKKENTGNATR